jgi:nucleotide-binding universal stress UspA family protein
MLYRIRTIVAGIESPEDDPILPPALELARRCGAFLHFVHAPEVTDLVWKEPRTAGEDDAAVAAPALDDEVVHFPPGDHVDYHAAAGPPGQSILQVAETEHADLVIVGATRRNRLVATLFGSTARRVSREAQVPVLVLRGHAPHQVSRVLVATDLSPASAGAHEIGLDVVDALFPGEDVAVRALDVGFDDSSLTPPLRGTLLDDVARDQLGSYLRERRHRARTVEPRVRFGDPVSEILEEAESWRADLIVLGSTGRTGAARVLMGSTAEGVLSHAKCAVLMVPHAAVEHATVPVRAQLAARPLSSTP